MIHSCIITDYTVRKVKMTGIKILIHQGMLRRTTCALFCGLVASSVQRPLSTEKPCVVYFACLQVLSTVKFEMFSGSMEPCNHRDGKEEIIIITRGERTMETERGNHESVFCTQGPSYYFQRKPSCLLITTLKWCCIVPRQAQRKTFCHLRSVKRFVVVLVTCFLWVLEACKAVHAYKTKPLNT